MLAALVPNGANVRVMSAARSRTPTVDAADDADDVALVGAIAAGDRAALGALYDRHGSLLLALALRIVRDRREAEDLLHDVFLELWRSAGDYDPGRGTVRAWLLLRTRCRAIDRRRSPRIARSESLDDGRERPHPLAPDPASAPDAERLRGALGTLPYEQRQVLELGYFDGLSSTEIAAVTGVPVGTVKSRVAAARAKLREMLTGDGEP